MAAPQCNKKLVRIGDDGVFTTYKAKLRKGETLRMDAG
jgi:hypothetical protein